MIFNMIASGGGASAPRFGVATYSPTSYLNTSLSFNGLLGEPQAFCVILVPKGEQNSIKASIGKNKFFITNFVYDGVEISTAVTGNNSGSYELCVYGNGYNATTNAYSFVYSNGTLTISRSSISIKDGTFPGLGSNAQYKLLYIY